MHRGAWLHPLSRCQRDQRSTPPGGARRRLRSTRRGSATCPDGSHTPAFASLDSSSPPAVAALILGVVQLRGAALDVYPQFGPPTVQVQTEALGLSAAEVEQFVTLPARAGPAQRRARGWPPSTPARQPGLSAIDLVFERRHRHLRRPPDGAGAADPGARAAERRQPAGHGPTAATAAPGRHGRAVLPHAAPRSTCRVLARWQIRPKLMGVPGVANVSIFGQRDRQLQVQVDPARLQREQGQPHPGHRDHRQRAVGLAADLRRGVDARHRRVRRVGEPAPRRPARLARSPRPQQLAAVPVEGVAGNGCGWATSPRSWRTTSRSSATPPPTAGPGLCSSSRRPPARTRSPSPGASRGPRRDAAGPGRRRRVDTQVYRPATYLETALRTLGLDPGGRPRLLMLVLLVLLGAWRAAVAGRSSRVPLTVVATAGLLSCGRHRVDDDDAARAGRRGRGRRGRRRHRRGRRQSAGHPAGTGSAGSAAVARRRRRSPRSSSPSPRCPCSRSGRSSEPSRLPLLLALGTGLVVATLVGLTAAAGAGRLLDGARSPRRRGRRGSAGPARGRGSARRRSVVRTPRGCPRSIAVAVLGAGRGRRRAAPARARARSCPRCRTATCCVRRPGGAGDVAARDGPHHRSRGRRPAQPPRRHRGGLARRARRSRPTSSSTSTPPRSGSGSRTAADRASAEAAITARAARLPRAAPPHVGDYTGDLLDQAGRGDDLVVRRLRRRPDPAAPAGRRPSRRRSAQVAGRRRASRRPARHAADRRRPGRPRRARRSTGSSPATSAVTRRRSTSGPGRRATSTSRRRCSTSSCSGRRPSARLAGGPAEDADRHPGRRPGRARGRRLGRGAAGAERHHSRRRLAQPRGDRLGARTATPGPWRTTSGRASPRCRCRGSSTPGSSGRRLSGRAQTRWVTVGALAVVVVALLALQALTGGWRRAALLLVLPVLAAAGAVAAAPLAGGITSAGALTGLAVAAGAHAAGRLVDRRRAGRR